ncbi:MAG: T9SS type A sorting domain-containing protein, partial [Eubacteriales bacterium]|nr:T9SS type A sorting domain-containing protein [Eubacteriales bacterium]
LTNHPRFAGFLNTIGCYDANIDYPTNCAASFVNNANGGGVAFVGNTRYGWYMPGQPGNGPSAQFTKEYVNQYATSDVYQNGMALALSKASFAGQVMSDYIVRFIFYEIYLTGDPDICVPNSAISTLAVDYPESVPGGAQTCTVTVTSAGRGPIEGALVCCYKENETHASGMTDASGSVALHIAPASQGIMHLTVTYFNGKTFEADVQVTSDATGVNLVSFDGIRMNDGAHLNWRVTTDGESAVAFNLYRREGSTTASVENTHATPSTATASKRDLAGWTLVNSTPIAGRNPYSYLDRNVGKGRYEYALEAITNGKHGALGNTNLPAATVAFSLNIAPNPVRSMANVVVGMERAGAVKMKFYDLAGRVVKTTTLNLSAGENTASVNLSGLAEGIYVVQAENAGSVLSRKIVVAR